jgi:O-antigen/teichoic acid export membrane protein
VLLVLGLAELVLAFVSRKWTGFAFTLIGNVLSPMLLALGETLASSAITFVSVVASLVVAFLLVPFLGIDGGGCCARLRDDPHNNVHVPIPQ